MDKAPTKGEEQLKHRAALTDAMDRYADDNAAAFVAVYDILAPRRTAFFLRSTRERAFAEEQTFVNRANGACG